LAIVAQQLVHLLTREAVLVERLAKLREHRLQARHDGARLLGGEEAELVHARGTPSFPISLKSDRGVPATMGERFYKACQHTIAPMLRGVWRVHATGLHHIPETGPAILASNHLSYTDHYFLP